MPDDLLIYDFESKIMKVISGGQTGADQGGLEAAKAVGIETGGIAPLGYRTELGPDLHLKTVYNLSEHSSADYKPRTKKNVMDSTITVIVGDLNSPGSRLTISFCELLKKPFFTSKDFNSSDLQVIAKTLKERREHIVLNVAGNRESVHPGIQERTRKFIVDLIELVNN